jgi:hypothetical protein
MNEVRRFFRFTIPGITCVLELFIALSISDNKMIASMLDSTGAVANIGLVFAIFLASGGLGYIFANIYFALYWWKPIRDRFAIDHCSLFRDLAEKIELVDTSGTRINPDDLSKRDAWNILTQFWYSQIEDGQDIKGVDQITDRLANITHSLGATVIGSLLSFIAWVSIHFSNPSRSFCIYGELAIIIVWLLLIFLMLKCHQRAQESLQSIANSTIANRITQKYIYTKIKIYYTS